MVSPRSVAYQDGLGQGEWEAALVRRCRHVPGEHGGTPSCQAQIKPGRGKGPPVARARVSFLE